MVSFVAECKLKYSLREYVSAYIKAAGIFFPTKYVWRPFGELLELDRCDVDGGLVTNSQRSLSHHLGHRMHQPVKIKLWEMLLIWTRIIA